MAHIPHQLPVLYLEGHLDVGRDSGIGCSSMWGCWGLEAPLLRWLDSPKTKLRWTGEEKQERGPQGDQSGLTGTRCEALGPIISACPPGHAPPVTQMLPMCVRRYHSVCFFPSQRYWPRPPGVSIPGDCPCLKMGGASAPVGEVHDDAPPGPPMTCQMLKGHLCRDKGVDITI